MTIDEMKSNYSWGEAFNYATFTMDDVAEIVASDDGYNDGDNWIGLFRLNDGTFGVLRAGCDYTGWDCRSSGDSSIHQTQDDAIQFGLGDEDRSRLGLKTIELQRGEA